jgi:hypothetical protein
LRKYLIDIIVEIKFRIKKYGQVFNGVGTGHAGVTKLILVG